MKIFLSVLKNLVAKFKIHIIVLCIGIVLGLLFSGKIIIPNNPNGANITTNQTHLIPMKPINNYTDGITNHVTITNIITLYEDDYNYNRDPFVNEQNGNKLKVTLWKRYETVNLDSWERFYFLGLGAEYSFLQNKFYPECIGGLQWNLFGGQLHISMLDVGADVFYRFNLN